MTGLASPAQVAALNNRFWYLGYRPADRQARLAACAVLLGVESLASAKDLTAGQAGRLVRVLGEFSTSSELQAALDAAAKPAGWRQADEVRAVLVVLVATACVRAWLARLSEGRLRCRQGR